MEVASAKPAPIKKERLRTRLWQQVVLSTLVGMTGGVQRLSRKRALRLGSALGRLACRVDGKRRWYAERNLRVAYGDALSAEERGALIQRTFEHWGKSLIDFLRAPALTDAQRDSLVTGVEGREGLEALRAEGKGFILVTGHLGNFEFLGRWLADQGVPSTVIVRDPSNQAFAAYVRKMREYGGNEALSRGTSPRELLSRLRKGRIITLGVDQNCNDLFVPFFGMPAGTPTGPAVIALRTGAKLLPAFCVREPDDSYRIIFGEPIIPEPTGDRDVDVARVTAQASAALERVVRRYPEQWLWLHNRWKSAFDEKNRARWPEGYDFDTARARWMQ
jgi:KDO2-lipid IV(A) lauroyltransferase